MIYDGILSHEEGRVIFKKMFPSKFANLFVQTSQRQFSSWNCQHVWLCIILLHMRHASSSFLTTRSPPPPLPALIRRQRPSLDSLLIILGFLINEKRKKPGPGWGESPGHRTGISWMSQKARPVGRGSD